MHVISQKRIVEAKRDHPNDANGLDTWYRVMKRAKVVGFADLRRVFPRMDRVGDSYIFDIGGNNLRLIAVIHFNRQKSYIRQILTHAEYNRWKA